MRLIDADALMQEYARFVAPSNNSDFEDVPTWNDAVSLLGSAPTIEPQRMRGRWGTIDGWDGDEVYRCSECGEEFVLIDGTPKENGYHFCPNCGADMRGGQDGKNS